MSSTAPDPYEPAAQPHLRSRIKRIFAVGGPAFNVGLIGVLGAMSAFIVAAPVRADEQAAVSEEQIDWLGLSGGEAPGLGVFASTAPRGGGGAGVGAVRSGGQAVGVLGLIAFGVQRAADQAVADLESAKEAPVLGAAAAPKAPDNGIAPAVSLSRDQLRPTGCDDFTTWQEAQTAFASSPGEMVALDGDGDGRACEGLPGTPPEAPGGSGEPAPAPKPDPQTTGTVKVWYCSDFPTQPEAQVAFDRDPIGFSRLDGDGDGRACEGLPGTPPTTEPDTFVVPSRAEVVSPAMDYFGLHTTEAPWWFGEVDELKTQLGKTPSTVLFFQKFNQPFPHQAVGLAWKRHALPIITWEPVIPGSGITQPKLSDLYGGAWDGYVDAWANVARDQGQPVVIRFAPEMNGSWYNWSEGRFGNAPGDYIQAWRYLHDRFSAAGASNVIWLWSPNRVDQQPTPLSAVYPGDAYVDWVGLSAYYRSTTGAPDFDTTFARTLTALRAVAAKPIFISETSADSGNLANDQLWIQNFFAGLAAQPDVVGFSWFNEEKSNNNWRMQRATEIVAQVAAGLATYSYQGGK